LHVSASLIAVSCKLWQNFPVAAANLPNQANTSNPPQTKQCVFTGTITKLHENFGFIDGESLK
jgi:hypothetical protein